MDLNEKVNETETHLTESTFYEETFIAVIGR